MISKNCILEMFDRHLSYNELFRKSFLEKIYGSKKLESRKINFSSIQDIKVELKNKNLFIIVHGEEVYVKIMTLPKVKKERIDFVIKEELRYRFKNLDNIMFTYEIIKSNEKSLDIIVFCLNWNQSDIINKCVQKGGNIKGIFPIQFCVLNKYISRIKEDNFILIFILEGNTYLVGCSINKVIGNTVIRNIDDNIFEEELDKFILKCSLVKNFEYVPSIIFLNFPNEKLKESISKTYKHRNLGNIKEEDKTDIFKNLI